MYNLRQHLSKIGLIGLIALSSGTTQAGTSNSVNLSLDGKVIGQGYISTDNDAMVPLRILSQNLKYNVQWDSPSETVIIQKGGTTIEVAVDYHLAKVNGKYIQLQSCPALKGGTTYVPLRFVMEVLGLQVGYANRTAYISTVKGPIVLPAGKSLSLGEMPTYLLGNGYERFSNNGIDYLKMSYDKNGNRYQSSFSQVIPESQIMTIWFGDNSTESMAFIKDMLNRVVPSGAEEIYKIISTENIIPLHNMELDGKQVVFYAKPNDSALHFVFDASSNKTYIKNVIKHEK